MTYNTESERGLPELLKLAHEYGEHPGYPFAAFNLIMFTHDKLKAFALAAIEKDRASRPAVQQEGLVSRKGFMCLIDFRLHLENDSHPSPIFSSIDDLRRDHKMVDECGIAEVDIRLVRALAASDGGKG